MAQLLPAALWEELEPLFPRSERSVLGGRPPAEHRVVLTAILFVLKTGIAWEDLPLELGCSYKTCKRRLTEWIESGLWRRLHEHLLAKLPGAGQIDWSRALLDSSHVKAPLGGEKWGRAPLIGAGRGSKHHLLTDGHGVPLSVTITAGNTHDIRAALATIVDLNPVRGKRGRPKSRPAQLIADKAYDDQALRDLLSWLGIKSDIPRRGDSRRGLGKQRWPIERTFAWLKQFRRLRTRWDKRADIHHALLQLASTIICYRIHTNGFCP